MLISFHTFPLELKFGETNIAIKFYVNKSLDSRSMRSGLYTLNQPNISPAEEFLKNLVC